MASAALKQTETEEIVDETVTSGEGETTTTEQTTERDFDAEARAMGWVPKDEFKGDPAKWVDKQKFVERGEEVLPLVKAQLARVKREFADFRKDARRISAQIEGAEKRAFEKAKSELEARIEAAIETGDLEAGRAALKEITELKPTSDDAGPKHTKEEAAEALDAFREEHPWYDKANLANASEVEINARLYFDRMIDKNIAKTEELAPAEFFAMITDLTLDKYPALKGKPARIKPASAVEGGGAGRGGRATDKTFANLPPEGQRLCDRLIAKGILANREEYLKTYDWSKP